MSEILFIYALTFTFTILLSYYGVLINDKNDVIRGSFLWNRYYILSFTVLTLFIGTREGIGYDFYSYKEAFENGGQIFEFGESSEIGYIWLTDFLHFLDFDYHSFFLLTSLITIFLFFKSFKNDYQLLPIGIFIFFVGGMYDFVINGIRQGIAVMAFYNALRYVALDTGNFNSKSKNFFWYCFYFAIGGLFHYSIFVFFPLIFILNKKFLSLFNSRILISIVFLGFFINSASLFNAFSSLLIDLIPKYEVYANPEFSLKREVGGFGIGAVIILFLNLLPLFFFDKIKKEYPNSCKYFVLYAIGTCMMYAFFEYMLVSRILIYMSLCNMFVFSYTFSYLKKKGRSDSNIVYILLNILIVSMLSFMYIYTIPAFMELHIIKKDYSLLFIPLAKY